MIILFVFRDHAAKRDTHLVSFLSSSGSAFQIGQSNNRNRKTVGSSSQAPANLGHIRRMPLSNIYHNVFFQCSYKRPTRHARDMNANERY